MRQLLTDYFRKNFKMSEDEIHTIESFFKPLDLAKESSLLSEGEISDFAVFIAQGVLRMHEYDEEGNDVTRFFFKEGQFVTNLESYTTGKPSKFTIQTITPCTLFKIKKVDTPGISKWPELFNGIVQQELSKKVRDQYQFRNYSAKEKYEHFLLQDGDIVNRVPLQFIASYLGMAPQSLSRIRRQI